MQRDVHRRDLHRGLGASFRRPAGTSLGLGHERPVAHAADRRASGGLGRFQHWLAWRQSLRRRAGGRQCNRPDRDDRRARGHRNRVGPKSAVDARGAYPACRASARHGDRRACLLRARRGVLRDVPAIDLRPVAERGGTAAGGVRHGQHPGHAAWRPACRPAAKSSRDLRRGHARVGCSRHRVVRMAGRPGDRCGAEGALDMRLIAVDAKSGQPCQDFGKNGAADLKVGLAQKDSATGPVTPVIPATAAITSAPVIVQGVVVSGHQVLDGQRRWAASGGIRGYDAVTGELRFAWDINQPEVTKLPPDGKPYSFGTPNMWTIGVGDEKLGLVYLPMGNSAGDYFSSLRSDEEKKYSSALVALDVTTGKPRWVFQTVHNDVWDYDLGSQPTLIEFPTTSGKVPAILLPTKNGDIFVLDRATGKPLHQVDEVAVPQGGAEPDQRSPTQPFSRHHTLRKPDLVERDMWGISPVDQMICRINFKRARYEGPFTPPELGRRNIEYPGYNGGSDWGSVAVDPHRGVIIANYNDMPNYDVLVTRKEADAMGLFPAGDPRAAGSASSAEGAGAQTGTPYGILVNAGWQMPTGVLCTRPPYGGIRAIDLATGKTLWDRPFGSARRNGPFGMPTFIPLEIGTPNNGGSVVTAGGLIFIAAATDDLIKAIDIRNGEILWSDVLPAGGQVTPIVYEQDGKEYLAIMAGGHHFMMTPPGDALIAYALPDTK